MENMTIENGKKVENVENQRNERCYVASGLNEVAESAHLYREGLSLADYRDHIAACGEPSLYVSTYGKYNDGNLAGMWVALDTFSDAEEFSEFCDRLHADEESPELMMQDFEGIPECLYSEAGTPSDLVWWWLSLNEIEREIIEDYADNINSDMEYAMTHAMSLYCCAVDSWDTYIDSQAGADDLPNWAQRYFDYEAYRRDCRYDFDFGEKFVFFAN